MGPVLRGGTLHLLVDTLAARDAIIQLRNRLSRLRYNIVHVKIGKKQETLGVIYRSTEVIKHGRRKGGPKPRLGHLPTK